MPLANDRTYNEFMAGLVDVEASCAICGGQQYPECPCEDQRMEIALNQATARSAVFKRMRDWVLDHARNEVQTIFEGLKHERYEGHVKYLQTLPCFTLYQKFHGNPPMDPSQLQLLHQRINHAQANYKAGVDDDWRRSCLKYPDLLDYFFGLVEIDVPDDREDVIREPRIGGPVNGERKLIKARRSSRGSTDLGNGRRKKERRRHSRGRTPGRR